MSVISAANEKWIVIIFISFRAFTSILLSIQLFYEGALDSQKKILTEAMSMVKTMTEAMSMVKFSS